MKRDSLLKNLDALQWDMLIIGGGATGLGTAVDASSRGYKTLLLEQDDFAKSSSSKSTKLIHGGVRYLQQGNIPLVKEALHERKLLLQNAPHLVHSLPFLVPLYRWWERPFYGIGLKLYDLLAGKMGSKRSHHLTKAETLKTLPNLNPDGLRGGVVYYDGQFDDARLAVALAQTAVREGATVLNYFKVISFIKKENKIVGVQATDRETGREYSLYAKVVINATGVFSDEIRHLDQPECPNYMAPSQGVHLVLPETFLNSKTAILVPRTDDGRVVFLIPWHGRVLVGTTDTALDKPVLEPRAKEEEIEFLLKHAARYLNKPPAKEDILCHFAGIRPLVREKPTRKTSSIARNHVIMTSSSGLVTIAGGKWTTYRKMAQDAVDHAAFIGKLSPKPCRTSNLKLFGYATGLNPEDASSVYGSELELVEKLCREDPSLQKKLAGDLPYTFAHVKWAIDQEMALNVEDILSRRTRLLILNARAAVNIAPEVAHFMATYLKRSPQWEEEQRANFSRLAKGYL